MVARKTAEADAGLLCPDGHLTQVLVGVFGKAEITKILAMRAVSVIHAGAVDADTGKRINAKEFSAEQCLCKANHIRRG